MLPVIDSHVQVPGSRSRFSAVTPLEDAFAYHASPTCKLVQHVTNLTTEATALLKGVQVRDVYSVCMRVGCEPCSSFQDEIPTSAFL